ncbi:LysR family transcriptional regulator [Aliamphritea spongicola]|uniref:LysR family transcriptional regulator n=1 Tax=Aliamphritea spongicola TaxID=707589 RepID=UPI00196B7F25|nr:LysR family transcriptional regulator [Aliamphritea spongicola]MBN3564265.1 LysR family transcriptional regulator [Aliamphritea spongicola]
MLADLKIAQLRHFIWVAELKGFHAAAERAHRTQPAISLSIRDLENKLGEALFEKHHSKTNKTELTPFGHYFLPKAKELISHHDRVAEDMELLAKHRTGHLRLASVPSIASRVLPALLQDFVTQAPDLHISCFDDNSDAVIRMIENQQVDFGLTNLLKPDQYTNLTFTPIWQDEVGVVCPAGHPLAGEESIDWKVLKNYRLIGNGTSRLLEGTDAAGLLDKSPLYVSNMISLLAMLDAGFGITTLPRYAFPENNPDLSFVPLHSPQVIRRIGVVQQTNRSLSPPAEAFYKFILQQCCSDQEGEPGNH